jgi:hypothetical protein
MLPASKTQSTAWYDDEWWSGNNLEGSGSGLIGVLYRYFRGGTKEN